jgi:hypothetical protein
MLWTYNLLAARPGPLEVYLRELVIRRWLGPRWVPGRGLAVGGCCREGSGCCGDKDAAASSRYCCVRTQEGMAAAVAYCGAGGAESLHPPHCLARRLSCLLGGIVVLQASSISSRRGWCRSRLTGRQRAASESGCVFFRDWARLGAVGTFGSWSWPEERGRTDRRSRRTGVAWASKRGQSGRNPLGRARTADTPARVPFDYGPLGWESGNVPGPGDILLSMRGLRFTLFMRNRSTGRDRLSA